MEGKDKILILSRMLRARYGKDISELNHRDGIKSFTIRHSDISDSEIANWVVYNKRNADAAIRLAIIASGVPEPKVTNLKIRYLRIPSFTPIRNLTSEHMGQTRLFEGIIRRVSEVKPKITVASFVCPNCGTHEEVTQSRDVLEYPDSKCDSCDKRVRWVLDPSLCKFVDSQSLLVQEYPEGLRGGEQPVSVAVELTSDLCKTTTPGQRVLIAGVLKAREVKRSDLKLELYVDGNSIEQKDELYENIHISEEECKRIDAISKTPDLLSIFVRSVAPTVYGNEEAKKGIVLQLFGGVTKTVGGSRIRGDIHVLFIGDPGIAKSVVMKYAASISPRGIFTHGNSSTKAGLTATAVKDGDVWVLEAGALVLADKGLCAVDELDKMNDQDREALHGAMEQQEIDIAKAGIVAKLLCRCSLLAAANPKRGRFDQFVSIPDQFNLPPTLVSRFDLIYPLMDIPDKEKDEAIANHILKTHTGGLDTSTGLEIDILKKYIAYARENYQPTLSKEATEVIKDYYLTVRSYVSNMATVPITARSLEGLVRLCEAAAKMRLSNIVSKEDAQLVVSIVDGCLRNIAYDAKSKTWDIDKVVGRYPKQLRNLMDKMTIAIHNCEDEHKWAKVSCVVTEMNRFGIDADEASKVVDIMREQKIIFAPREGYIKIL